MSAQKFNNGDAVKWNSQVGYTHGHIVKIHTESFEVDGHNHRASETDPLYEVESAKTKHIAYHKGSALHHEK